jgi:hypothetical protein
MSRRELSMTAGAIRARERRLDALVRREEMKFNAEVKLLMDRGLSFDEAWIAAGGQIIEFGSS